MNYRNELKSKLSAICDYINHIGSETENITLIDKDILLEKIRSTYEYLHNIPVYASDLSFQNKEHAIFDDSAPEAIEFSKDTDDSTVESKPLFPNEPIFAPKETENEIAVVAEPIMQGVENENYVELFDNIPQTNTTTQIDDNETPLQEVVSSPNEIQHHHIQQTGKQENTQSSKTTDSSEQPIQHSKQTKENQKGEKQPELQHTPPASDEHQDKPQTGQSQTEPSLFDYLSRTRETKNSQTIGDKFENDQTRIGDHIAQQNTLHKVSDLRTVININDKFSFVGALFHNNMRAYTDFILHLNALGTRNEAINYVSDIAQQYNWNMDSLEVKSFNKILDRKF